MTLRGVTLVGVIAVYVLFARLSARDPGHGVTLLHRNPVTHGGCARNDRLGPDTWVCQDGTVWHHRVDGPEYEGNLNAVHGPTLLVPAPQK